MMKEIIDFKHLDKGKDLYYNVRHSHGDSYEIVLVLDGSGAFIVRDRLFDIKPLSLYFINGIETHCSVPNAPDLYTRRKIVIDANFIDELAKLLGCIDIIDILFKNNGGERITLNSDTVLSVDAQFYAISKAINENSPLSKMKVTSALLSIFAIAKENISEQPLYSDTRIAETLEYINKNLCQNVSLEKICKHVHLSKYHLCHLFKKTVGMSVFEYLLSRRLSNAKKQLLETSAPVSEIAIEVGFSDFSYFSKIFKLHEGLSPSEFRAINKRK